MADSRSTARGAKEPKARERLNREEWLREALEVLSQKGESKVRVESICRSLNVTKGSFYWHFKDRQDFLESIVKFWNENYNREVILRAQGHSGSAEERLRLIFEFVTRENLSRYDVAFDAWAAHEPGISEMVAEAYRLRFDGARALFRELGFRGIDLDTRTTAFIAFLKSGSLVSGKSRETTNRRRIDSEFRFFTHSN